MGFRDLMREVSPGFLRQKWGERFMYAPGLVLDGIMEWALLGVKARFPDKAPDDALAALGRDRRIRRGFAEPAAIYRLRLKRWLQTHKTRGNAFTLMEEIRSYLHGYAVRIRCVNDRGSWQTIHPDGTYEVNRLTGNWDWDGRFPATARTRFWVIIYPLSTGLWAPDGEWGDGGRWGDGRTWGTTATRQQVDTIRQIVEDGRPQGARCVNIIIAFDAASFDPEASPGAPLPDGLWGSYGKEVAGVWVRSRLATARYWRGTR